MYVPPSPPPGGYVGMHVKRDGRERNEWTAGGSEMVARQSIRRMHGQRHGLGSEGGSTGKAGPSRRSELSCNTSVRQKNRRGCVVMCVLMYLKTLVLVFYC